MILCWTGITIYRLVIIARPEQPLQPIFLWTSHVILHLQGVMDAAVFFSYDSVQAEYRLLLDRWFGEGKATLLLKTRPSREKNQAEMTSLGSSNSSSDVEED